MSDQQIVKDWMQRFGQETPETPVIPSLEVRRLRAKLHLEECFESIEALGFRIIRRGDKGSEVLSTDLDFVADREPNLEAIADGCADLRVVTVGTEVACGIPGDKTFAEVMRSNESKLWTDEESENPNLDSKYSVELVPGFDPMRDDDERIWLVKDKDGKVIKSPSYSPANLKPILTKQETTI